MKDEVDEDVCEHCELNILGCKHSTSTFLCEGCCCDEALESYNEEYLNKTE